MRVTQEVRRLWHIRFKHPIDKLSSPGGMITKLYGKRVCLGCVITLKNQPDRYTLTSQEG